MRGGSARNGPYLFPHERVGILLVKVYKGKGDLCSSDSNKVHKGQQMQSMGVNSDHRSVLWSIYIFKTMSLEQLKGMQSFKPDKWRGYLLSIEVIGEGCLFCQKRYIKAEGAGPRGVASPYKTLFPPPFPPGVDNFSLLYSLSATELVNEINWIGFFETKR